MGSGQLRTTLHNLANSDLPAAPPSFAALAGRVEGVEGVRFRALFERLPRTAPDGDAAIAAVWELVTEEKKRRGAGAQRREEMRSAFASLLPPEVIVAMESGDAEQAQAALAQFLEQMTPEQRQAFEEQMTDLAQAAGVQVRQQTGPDTAQVPQHFEPLLQAIAAAAHDESHRAKIEPLLGDLEERGWMLGDPVRRMWAGERDAAALTEGLDEQDGALVRRVLELLEG
jgi:hypothetical protein